MEIQKLKKEDFPVVNIHEQEPYIRFYASGKIVLNKSAVSHLRLLSENGWGGVSFYHDARNPAEISISGDINGWQVRPGTGGGCIFNNRNLARHVIDLMWGKVARPAGDTSPKPGHCSFHIARLPIDDVVHKNIFCLIRKK